MMKTGNFTGNAIKDLARKARRRTTAWRATFLFIAVLYAVAAIASGSDGHFFFALVFGWLAFAGRWKVDGGNIRFD